MNIENTLGQKIRQLRKAKGLTQEQLAEKLDIDNKHLSRIEKGKHMPTYAVTKKLAEVLQFDIYNFENTPIEKIDIPDPIYLKALKIFNSARSKKEKEYYLEALKFAQKGLRLNKSAKP